MIASVPRCARTSNLAGIACCLLTQFSFVDLAEAAERQRLSANVPAFRAFVAGDQIATARLEVALQLAALDIGPTHDHGVNPFAPALIRKPDHGARGYRRMRRDDVLDFSGIDIFATRYDHVLE